ncbi:MAG: hypothetical protein MK108_14035 [Mariniblastus sp.]|nr:hypothetical protein [Mariniblastus sp.]
MSFAPIPMVGCPRSILAIRTLLLSLIVAFLSYDASPSAADELILSEQQSIPLSIGDFQCSSGPAEQAGFIIENLVDSGGQVRTGKLWDYFNSQGVETLDRLTLVINVNPDIGSGQQFTMDSLTLTIAGNDAGNEQSMITDVSMSRNGENLLVLRSDDFKSFAPKARMEFDLGYDFMERFTADSLETLSLNFHTRSGAIEQALLGFPSSGHLEQESHLPTLLLFITFWTVVFLLMYLFLSPKGPEEKNKKTSASNRSSTSQRQERSIDPTPNPVIHHHHPA